MSVAFWVPLEARPGLEREAELFLKTTGPVLDEEDRAAAWMAIRMSVSRFAIFDAAAHEPGRQAHLANWVACVLVERAPHLFVDRPGPRAL